MGTPPQAELGGGATLKARPPPAPDRLRAKPIDQLLRGVLVSVPGTVLDVETVRDVQRRARLKIKILSDDDAVRTVIVDPGSGSILSVD